METNRCLAQSSFFGKLCKEADVEATKRQASKFRNGKGRAYYLHKQKQMKDGNEQILSSFFLIWKEVRKRQRSLWNDNNRTHQKEVFVNNLSCDDFKQK